MTTESTLRDALASEFEQYAVHERLRERDRNAVYSVTVDGRRAACKLTDCQPGMLAREGAVLRAVADRTPVPVPSVLASGGGYLVQAWAEGDPFDGGDLAVDPGANHSDRLRAVGRTLGRLHAATAGWFDDHGALERGPGPLAVTEPTGWPDRLAAFVDDWAAGLAGTRDADVAAAVTELVADHREAFADPDPVLVHGEPCPDHVRFDGTDVAALLDWEIAQAAPGEFDLVWAERDFLRTPRGSEVDDDLRAALQEGYEAERPPTDGSAFRRELYRAAFAMRDLRLVDGDERRELRGYAFERLDAASRAHHPGSHHHPVS